MPQHGDAKLLIWRSFARNLWNDLHNKVCTATLLVMRKSLRGLIVLLCCVPECLAQSRWVLPELQELTEADAIGRGSAQLSSDETALLKNLTHKIIAVCIADPGPGDAHTAAGTFRRMRVRRVSLTPQGDAGLVMQGFGSCMCGAVGNCPFWIIGEQPHPRALMHTIGIQTFAFQKSLTSSHFDLVLGRHDSAMATELHRFKFDGTNYKRNGCAFLEWADEVARHLKPPRITPERCP